MRGRACQLEAATSEAAFPVPIERITKIFCYGSVGHANAVAVSRLAQQRIALLDRQQYRWRPAATTTIRHQWMLERLHVRRHADDGATG